MNSFYTEEELKTLGLKSFGENVLISKKTSIYGASNISIGNNVRIDDFCIISGNITLGNYIHIGAFSALYGQEEIIMKDFSGLSSRVTLYTVSDDYSGRSLTNPLVSEKYKKLRKGKIVIGKHCIIGASTVILPKVIVGDGTSVGAMSLVIKSTKEWGTYFGIPVVQTGERKKDLLLLEKEFLNELEKINGKI